MGLKEFFGFGKKYEADNLITMEQRKRSLEEKTLRFENKLREVEMKNKLTEAQLDLARKRAELSSKRIEPYVNAGKAVKGYFSGVSKRQGRQLSKLGVKGFENPKKKQQQVFIKL